MTNLGQTALSIGVLMDLVRRGTRRSQQRADALMADTMRRERIGQAQEAQRRTQLLQRERDMTRARMHMALQDRGIYAYGDPTSAAYTEAAAARRGVGGPGLGGNW